MSGALRKHLRANLLIRLYRAQVYHSRRAAKPPKVNLIDAFAAGLEARRAELLATLGGDPAAAEPVAREPWEDG